MVVLHGAQYVVILTRGAIWRVWTRKAYVNKIILELELEFILHSVSPHNMCSKALYNKKVTYLNNNKLSFKKHSKKVFVKITTR